MVPASLNAHAPALRVLMRVYVPAAAQQQKHNEAKSYYPKSASLYRRFSGWAATNLQRKATLKTRIFRHMGSRVHCSTRSSSGTKVSSDDSHLQPFLNWLSSSGAVFANVQIANLDGRDGGSGWGVVALNDAKEGDVMVRLPASTLLTYNDQCEPALHNLIQKVPAELWGARLGLRLLAERAKGPESRWAPYIGLLPIQFKGIPIFFHGDAIRALQYPPVSVQVGKRCQFLIDFASEIAQVRGTEADPFPEAEVDANALGWALAAVSSRAFRVAGPDQPAAMLPLIDMANHSFDNNCGARPYSDGGIEMYATRNIKGGEALLMNYGNLPNDFLMLDYGFIIPGNPHDYISLRFDDVLLERARMASKMSGETFGDLENLPRWQEEPLEKLGLVGQGVRGVEVKLGGEEGVDGRLVGALRILYARKASEIRDVPLRQLTDLDFSLSHGSDVRVLSTLLGAAAIAMNGFPTTLQDDAAELVKLVQDPASDDNMRMAVEFRMAKKNNVMNVLQNLSNRLKVLSEEVKAADGSMRGSRLGNDVDKPKGFGRG